MLRRDLSAVEIRGYLAAGRDWVDLATSDVGLERAASLIRRMDFRARDTGKWETDHLNRDGTTGTRWMFAGQLQPLRGYSWAPNGREDKVRANLDLAFLDSGFRRYMKSAGIGFVKRE